MGFVVCFYPLVTVGNIISVENIFTSNILICKIDFIFIYLSLISKTSLATFLSEKRDQTNNDKQFWYLWVENINHSQSSNINFFFYYYCYYYNWKPYGAVVYSLPFIQEGMGSILFVAVWVLSSWRGRIKTSAYTWWQQAHG